MHEKHHDLQRLAAWLLTQRKEETDPDGDGTNHRVADMKVQPVSGAPALAANRVPEGPTGLSHTRLGQRSDASPEGPSGDGVDVVEVHYTITRHTVAIGPQLEFRDQIPLCTSQRGDRHRSDPLCNWIAR